MLYIKSILKNLTLQRTLQLNASSCLMFGSLFISSPALVANFLSMNNPAPDFVLIGLGVILISNGLHLIWAS